jgi:nicotinamidase-related amidase
MALKNEDLHGNAPDKANAALLLIDVINDLEFPEGDQLLQHAMPMARSIVALKGRARKLGIPAIYVNDNFGRWRSDFRRTVAHCTSRSSPGRLVSKRLKPTSRDYFVLKPKHSGFFGTTLDTLLEMLRIRRVILTGIAGNICVLFTANDAYMRDLELFAPSDCIVSNTAADNQHALRQIATVLKGDITSQEPQTGEPRCPRHCMPQRRTGQRLPRSRRSPSSPRMSPPMSWSSARG